MALTRPEKEVQVAELTKDFSNASSVIFAHYIGLNVAAVSALRRELKNGKAKMQVAKKTLVRLATKASGQPEVHEDTLQGPIACIFSFEDPIAGAQIALKFAKNHPQVALIGGLFDRRILSKAEAMRLATMPNRQVLLGMFAMMLRSPLTQFASACSSPLRSFAIGMSELAKKKESAAA